MIMPIIIPLPNDVGGGGVGWRWWYIGFTLYVCLSVRPSACLSVCMWDDFQSINRVDLGTPISNFICMLFVAMDRSLLIFNDVTSKMAAWRSYCFYSFRTLTFVLLWISTPNFGNTLPVCMGRGLFIVGDVTPKKTTRVALFLVSEANFIWALHINS